MDHDTKKPMEASIAHAYLKYLRQHFATEEGCDVYCRALDVALAAVAPPLGAGTFKWVYLPDEDLTPYEHLQTIHEIDEKLNEIFRCIDESDLDETMKRCITLPIRFNHEKKDCMQMALTIYRTVLLDIHARRLRDEVKGLVKTACENTEATDEA